MKSCTYDTFMLIVTIEENFFEVHNDFYDTRERYLCTECAITDVNNVLTLRHTPTNKIICQLTNRGGSVNFLGREVYSEMVPQDVATVNSAISGALGGGTITSITTNAGASASLSGGVLNIPPSPVQSLTTTAAASPTLSSGVLNIPPSAISIDPFNGSGYTDSITVRQPTSSTGSVTQPSYNSATFDLNFPNYPAIGLAASLPGTTPTLTYGANNAGTLTLPSQAVTSVTFTGSGSATLTGTVLNIPPLPVPAFQSLTTNAAGNATLTSGVLNIPANPLGFQIGGTNGFLDSIFVRSPSAAGLIAQPSYDGANFDMTFPFYPTVGISTSAIGTVPSAAVNANNAIALTVPPIPVHSVTFTGTGNPSLSGNVLNLPNYPAAGGITYTQNNANLQTLTGSVLNFPTRRTPRGVVVSFTFPSIPVVVAAASPGAYIQPTGTSIAGWTLSAASSTIGVSTFANGINFASGHAYEGCFCEIDFKLVFTTTGATSLSVFLEPSGNVSGVGTSVGTNARFGVNVASSGNEYTLQGSGVVQFGVGLATLSLRIYNAGGQNITGSASSYIKLKVLDS